MVGLVYSFSSRCFTGCFAFVKTNDSGNDDITAAACTVDGDLGAAAIVFVVVPLFSRL